MKSRILAMQARRNKGLLSKTEEVRLAELMAQMHVKSSAGDKKEDCLVM